MTLATSREQIERVCRMYKSNTDACKALGIGRTTFQRALKRYGIIPSWKKRTRSNEAKR